MNVAPPSISKALLDDIAAICSGPMQLHGWCSPAKAAHIAEAVLMRQPRIVVEIGVFGGRSFLPAVLALQILGGDRVAYGIDPWCKSAALEGMDEHDADDRKHIEYWSAINYQQIMGAISEYIEARKLWKYAALVQAKADQFAPVFPTGEAAIVDFLHIDGNHTTEVALRDATTWLPRCRSGALIFADDTNWASTQPMVKLIEKHCAFVSRHPGVGTEYSVYTKN